MGQILNVLILALLGPLAVFVLYDLASFAVIVIGIELALIFYGLKNNFDKLIRYISFNYLQTDKLKEYIEAEFEKRGQQLVNSFVGELQKGNLILLKREALAVKEDETAIQSPSVPSVSSSADGEQSIIIKEEQK